MFIIVPSMHVYCGCEVICLTCFSYFLLFVGVLPYCPLPPHKYLLDCLLEEPSINRSVATLLSDNLILHIADQGEKIRRKNSTYRDTTEEESSSSNSSDSCSEYDPSVEMTSRAAAMLEERNQQEAQRREAQFEAQRAKVRRTSKTSDNRGKSSSSNITNALSTELAVQPLARVTPAKSKTKCAPATTDVDNLARWKPPTDIDESSRVEYSKLPKLPTPRVSSSFGILGTGPKYARHVIGPYMSFSGDKTKLSSQSSSDIFDSMMESTADVGSFLFYLF